MTQKERRVFLINYLKNEEESFKGIVIPHDTEAQKHLLRALMNVRPPMPVSKDFTDIQDEYLQQENRQRGIVSLGDLSQEQPEIYLWQGDITRLSVDAIVNAANSAMLGCFVPCHGCIDNAIHSAAGVQLRLECARIMDKQEKPEETGRAKITKGYNLPCQYVLHTVGPTVHEAVTEKDCEQLRSCYRSCLELAATYHLNSIAFCCISTGEFHFPHALAAEIATQTILHYQQTHQNRLKVIFNVFKDKDYELYKRKLERHCPSKGNDTNC